MMTKPLKRLFQEGTLPPFRVSALERRVIQNKAVKFSDMFSPTHDYWQVIKASMMQYRFPKFCLEKPVVRVSFEVQHVKKFKRRRIETGILDSLLVKPKSLPREYLKLCQAVPVARHRLNPVREVHPRMPLAFLSAEERIGIVRPEISLLSAEVISRFKRPVLQERTLFVDEEAVNLYSLRNLESPIHYTAVSENKFVRNLPGLQQLHKLAGRAFRVARPARTSHQGTGNLPSENIQDAFKC